MSPIDPIHAVNMVCEAMNIPGASSTALTEHHPLYGPHVRFVRKAVYAGQLTPDQFRRLELCKFIGQPREGAAAPASLPPTPTLRKLATLRDALRDAPATVFPRRQRSTLGWVTFDRANAVRDTLANEELEMLLEIDDLLYDLEQGLENFRR